MKTKITATAAARISRMRQMKKRLKDGAASVVANVRCLRAVRAAAPVLQMDGRMPNSSVR